MLRKTNRALLGVCRVLVERAVQRPAELVGSKNVETSVAQVGRRRHQVEHPLDRWADPLLGGSAPGRAPGCGGSHQPEEVITFRLVELERVHDTLQDAVGDLAHIAALEPGVVLDADPGEQRRLFPAETGDPPARTVDRKPDLLRRDLRAPGGEKLAKIILGTHGFHRTDRSADDGDPVRTPIRPSWSQVPVDGAS